MQLTCDPGQVMVLSSASYGRMQLSRCIVSNEAIGCSNDVMFLLDQWFSGLPSCEKDVPNEQLTLANVNCMKALRAYLDVSYSCLKGRYIEH